MRHLTNFLRCLASLSLGGVLLGAEDAAGDNDRSSPIFAPLPLPSAPNPLPVRSHLNTRMDQQVAQFVKADTQKMPVSAPPVAANPSVVVEDSIELDPMKVQAVKEMKPLPRETRFQRYLRTGTLWQTKDGRARIGLAPDKGLFFSFEW